MSKMMMIDGLQYSHWSRKVFEQMRDGGLSAVHVTIAYHEVCRETLYNIGHWNRMFEMHSDLIVPVHTAADIEAAHAQNKVGIIFGFQNCSPIEDDIDLVAIFNQLGVKIMQLTYNNQSLLATGCYEKNDSGVTRMGKEVIKEMNKQLNMQVDHANQSASRSGSAYKFQFTLESLDGASPTPGVLDKFELAGCYIQNINYGDMAYGSSEQVQVTVSIRYDNAEIYDAAGNATLTGETLDQTLSNASGAGTQG